VPLSKPEVDRDLAGLSPVARSAEVLRYQLLQVECALSPGGGLRAWLKLNVLAALLFGIPALLVVPIVTELVGAFAKWTAFLLQAALNVLHASLAMAAVLVIVLLLAQAVKAAGRNGRHWR
jgi:hypothetical protein